MRKKQKLIRNIIISLSIVLLVAVGVIVYGKLQLTNMENEKLALMSEMEANKQLVYVAIDRINKGDLIISDTQELTEGQVANVTMQEVYTGLEPFNYITEEQLGYTAVVDIDANVPVMVNMVNPLVIKQDTREYEMQVVNLMTDQNENEYIDIRIMYPNGEDYTVLSKKIIKNLNLEACVFYSYLSAEEILRMSSATVDAYTITGTRIYAVRYVESNVQDEAIPNYLVKPETIDLINSDPNVLSIAQNTLNVQARMSLEQRLSGLPEEQLEAVSAGHGLQDTAQTSVITSSSRESAVSGNEVSAETTDTAAEVTEEQTTDAVADESNVTVDGVMTNAE